MTFVTPNIASGPVPGNAEHYGGFVVPRRALDGWIMAPYPSNTTLAANLTAGATTVTFDQPLKSTPQRVIAIDSEQMFMTAGNGTGPLGLVGATSVTVVRGVNGTAAVAHNNPAAPSVHKQVRTTATRHVVILGDSLAQCSIQGTGFDQFPNRFARRMAAALGLPLLGPGFYGLWRGIQGSGSFTANEWAASGDAGATWQQGAAYANQGFTKTFNTTSWNLAPLGFTYGSNGASANNQLRFQRPPDFNPTVAWQLDVWYIDLAGFGNWSYSLDQGATWTAVSGNLGPGTPTLRKFSIAMTTAQWELRLRAADAAAVGAACAFAGVTLWNQGTAATFDTPGFMVHNMGVDGQGIGQAMLGTAPNPATGADFLRMFDGDAASLMPSLVFAIYSNDAAALAPNTTTVDGYRLQFDAWAGRMNTYANLCYINPFEQQNIIGNRTTTRQAQYRAAAKQGMAANGGALVDLYDAYVAEGLTGFDACNAEGLMFDGLHPSQLGSNEIAARIARLLDVAS